MVHEVEKIEEETVKVTGVYVWPYVDYIRIAKLDDGAYLPDRNHAGDAGLDFYALKNTIINGHSIKVVKTGITVELPPHYFGLMKPNGGSDFDVLAGVIDPGYQGEILVKLYNPKAGHPLAIKAGDPIAQMVLIPIIRPDLKLVDKDEIHKVETDRGETGGIVKDVE